MDEYEPTTDDHRQARDEGYSNAYQKTMLEDIFVYVER